MLPLPNYRWINRVIVFTLMALLVSLVAGGSAAMAPAGNGGTVHVINPTETVLYLPLVAKVKPPMPFEPVDDTELEPGDHIFSSIHVPEGVTVTMQGDVTIDVVGDTQIDGTLRGDCTDIQLVGHGDITVLGSINNQCPEGGDETDAGDLVIQSLDGSVQIGDIADNIVAEVYTSGNLEVISGPDVPDWWFDVLPDERSDVKLPPVCSARADILHDSAFEDMPAEVRFFGGAADPDGGGITYAWDFGDGASATEQEPIHSYTSPGVFDVVLNATDDEKQTCEATLRLLISDEETLPEVPAAWAEPFDLVVAAGEEAWFAADALDALGQELTYLWDFGDGTSSDVAEPSHTYTDPGRYEVSLTVTDTDNLSSTVATSIYVFSLEAVSDAPSTGTSMTNGDVCRGEIEEFGVLVNGEVKYSGTAPPLGKRGYKYKAKTGQRVVIGPKANIEAPKGADGEYDEHILGKKNGKTGGFFKILGAGDVVICGGAGIASGDGGKGADIEVAADEAGENATARGGKGGNGGLIKIRGRSVTFGEGKFGIGLVPGNGGEGGEATASGAAGEDKCPQAGAGGLARATGGQGGKGSNVEIHGTKAINVDAVIIILRGDGGKGGNATATGSKGGMAECEGERAKGGKGGKAKAMGGNGGRSGRLVPKNLPELSFPAPFEGGPGGKATANGGEGGAAIVTGTPSLAMATALGGAGGDATATGGNGGWGFTFGGNAGDADATGGKGGDATATGSPGADCSAADQQAATAGGAAKAEGGPGGTANASPGRAGKGEFKKGSDGTGFATGGAGGTATATGGGGGSCQHCGDKRHGADGGKATAIGGKGGDAKQKWTVGRGKVTKTAGAGGDATVYGGHGGSGADCCEPNDPQPGGNGGKGGDAEAKPGKAGEPDGTAADGEADGKGGNGGNGGKGLKQGGTGGAKGDGKPDNKVKDGDPGAPGGLCPKTVVEDVVSTFVPILDLDPTSDFSAEVEVDVQDAYTRTLIHGLELLFADQDPAWTAADFAVLPEGWDESVIQGEISEIVGIRLYAGDAADALRAGSELQFEVAFSVEGETSLVPDDIWMHATDENVFNVGYIISEAGELEPRWMTDTVDSATEVGLYNSLAFDGVGYPHISYYNQNLFQLKYARWTGADWAVETVDSSRGAGLDTSLALDGTGNPHISYYDISTSDLKYARWDGNQWLIQTVDSIGHVGSYTSLALDADGNPHISYRDHSNGDLKYALWTGAGWITQTVDSAANVGFSTSLALDTAGNAHISYYDLTNGDLKYAWGGGEFWSIETVDTAGDVGNFSSLALDAYDSPHISYFDETNDDLKYARRMVVGRGLQSTWWTTETIDSEGSAGVSTSLALDGSGNPHISYYDITNTRVKYARWTGTDWRFENVAVAGDRSRFASLALDGAGHPHISYYDDANGVLNYTRRRGSTLPVMYDFDYALNANGDLATVGEYLNNDVFLYPDYRVRFERSGETRAIVDGGGTLRLERDYWHEDDQMYFVYQQSLPETYALSIKDLWRTHPGTGVYAELTIGYTDDNRPPRLADMAPDRATRNSKFVVMPDAYASGQLHVWVYYRTPDNVVYCWVEDHWDESWSPTQVISSGFTEDVGILIEVIKDHQGYRARITRLDTSEVLLETTPVPPDAMVASDKLDFALFGAYRWWIGESYVAHFDDWSIIPLGDSDDPCYNCPSVYIMD